MSTSNPLIGPKAQEVVDAETCGRRVAIVQSSYIPWKGYFDMIAAVNEFILLDDVQFTKRDWRNRNKIKTAQGIQWLSIPVKTKSRYAQLIEQTEVADSWAERHWRSISLAYAKAPHFPDYKQAVEALYSTAAGLLFLSEINRLFLEGLCRLLSIETPLRWSHDYPSEGSKTDKLLALCRAASATRYFSGPAAKVYLDRELFEAAGIAVEWMNYDGYPPYPQLHGPFEEKVSVLDLLFNLGPEARRHMKH